MARSAEKVLEVLRKDTEGFQNIAKTCWNISILRIPLSGTLTGA